MINKLKDICEKSNTTISKIINNKIESFMINKIIVNGKSTAKVIKHIEKGIYLFFNNEDIVVYIGQGGAGKSTLLKERILQELRNYKKNDNGNNGGTLSKNIQSVDKINFDKDEQFKNYIKDWKMKILNTSEVDIHIDILESICIELYNPKYNIKGKHN